MPSKKKKYNARFPSGRIKKIMQTDEEVGKVAQAVPVIISRTLELFVESLLRKAMQITSARNAKTLTPSHMKQCILSESRFDFLKDLVNSLPDATTGESEEGPLTIVLPAQSSSNHAIKSENVRYPSSPIFTSTYSRQPPPSVAVQQCQQQPEQLGNGTNANFYVENVEARASFNSAGPLIRKVEAASDDSDDEYEETFTECATVVAPPECAVGSNCGAAAVDEDYDT